MPYVRKGNTIYKRGGKKVGTSRSPKKYLRVLRAVEHGYKPSRKGRRR